MAVHFAFHLGSLAFITTLIRSAIENATFTDGLQTSFGVGLVFFGIGFAVGTTCRLMIEELTLQELAASSEIQNGERSDLKSSANSSNQ
ncbi:MAG: hypothetical protein KDA78_07280 [Planctomycetaceae bacterium]|nr:hypothetical protein [Planctomycetaceae bacterium]